MAQTTEELNRMNRNLVMLGKYPDKADLLGLIQDARRCRDEIEERDMWIADAKTPLISCLNLGPDIALGILAQRASERVAELEESLLHESDSASKWAAKCHQLEAETERLDRYLEESRDSRDAAIAEAGRLEAENQRLRAVIDQAERKAYGVAATLSEAIAKPPDEHTERDSPV